jgi:hypothetical protein
MHGRDKNASSGTFDHSMRNMTFDKNTRMDSDSSSHPSMYSMKEDPHEDDPPFGVFTVSQVPFPLLLPRKVQCDILYSLYLWVCVVVCVSSKLSFSET